VTHSVEQLWSAIRTWIDDPESSVEYAEQVEGSVAMRMRQEARDASTVWWTPRQRSLTAELLILPAPERNAAACYRLALDRNRSTFRCWYALDVDGGVVLRSRLVNEEIAPEVLDSVLGEMYEQVEVTFRPLVRLAFDRG
jgi:hypothetical protein